MSEAGSQLYPELTTRAGQRDRPRHVAPSVAGWWRVVWRSGRVAVYDRDPRAHLSLGYEPRMRTPHPARDTRP
jgi:hypothetical protein